MSKPLVCCFCGRALSLQGQCAHQEHCLFGPMGERVKKFTRKHVAEHGRITTREWEANQERRDLGLPGYMHIIRELGTWPEFMEWCGVAYRRESRRIKGTMSEEENMRRIDKMLAEGKAALESAYDFRAIPVVRQYTERYRDLDTGEVHDRYVMVLR